MQHYQLHREKIKYFIVLIGTIFLLTINMCDHGRTITHLQISRFHTKVWYNATDSMAPSQYPKRRLSVKSRKVSKPRDRYFKLSYRFAIWQAHRQHCCRSACQISERSDNSKYKSRGFETLRDLTERRLFGYWDGAQYSSLHIPSTTIGTKQPRSWGW